MRKFMSLEAEIEYLDLDNERRTETQSIEIEAVYDAMNRVLRDK